ncbi:MAG: hypothetical protein HYY58_04920 [Candidatus Omnitrophica bacterium]|nr:hypothetical protein [Candidatus Omnitrophota bacterium]
MSRIVCLLAGLVATCVFSEKYASGQAARIFRNATYLMGNEYGVQAATLVDGIHDEPYLYVRYGDQYVYGDFNGDGLKDAAVILMENNGGTAEWYALAFLINDGEKLVHRASRELDDRAVINSMREKDGKVWIDMFVHQDGDCMAGPTKRVRNVYTYDGPDRWGEIEESPYQRIYSDGSKAFQEIYGTPIPAQIRQAFDRTLHVHQTCSAGGCAFTVLDAGKPVGIFTKKFILVDVAPDGSSGVSATLVFEGASSPFLLRMDDTGGGTYELRTMAELPGLLGEGLVRQLQNPAYRRYWL